MICKILESFEQHLMVLSYLLRNLVNGFGVEGGEMKMVKGD